MIGAVLFGAVLFDAVLIGAGIGNAGTGEVVVPELGRDTLPALGWTSPVESGLGRSSALESFCATTWSSWTVGGFRAPSEPGPMPALPQAVASKTRASWPK